MHMATHAQIESDYRRSFLLAHDDLITMDELEDSDRQPALSRIGPVDLLVLSACRTAAGDERAALGLAGVAVKAGARSALASLWAVNDESTALLDRPSSTASSRRGASKAAALRGAQLALHERRALFASRVLGAVPDDRRLALDRMAHRGDTHPDRWCSPPSVATGGVRATAQPARTGVVGRACVGSAMTRSPPWARSGSRDVAVQGNDRVLGAGARRELTAPLRERKTS